MQTNRVFVLGKVHRAEFIPVYNRIIEMIPEAISEKIPEMASEHLGSFLFQSYSGEFSQSVVNRLIAAEPLAPILLFLGSASEGESRTGHPLFGCFRFYVHQWNEYYQHQLSLHWNGKPSFFSLPRTLENDEIALFHAAVPFPNRFNSVSQNRNCLIVSHWGTLGNDSAMNQFLADFYRHWGFNIGSLNHKISQSFNGIIVADADDSPFPKILESVQRLRHDFADAKITVCINSPRINEKIDLQNAGVNEIISKPVFW
ncbi:MAG: hypothetical protein LBQ50_07040 [Planctomycetaceae bacterium]|jgi:hypothetical protein|nr:hypothetical protein [Planctomycetaceae bacterium]